MNFTLGQGWGCPSCHNAKVAPKENLVAKKSFLSTAISGCRKHTKIYQRPQRLHWQGEETYISILSIWDNNQTGAVGLPEAESSVWPLGGLLSSRKSADSPTKCEIVQRNRNSCKQHTLIYIYPATWIFACNFVSSWPLTIKAIGALWFSYFTADGTKSDACPDCTHVGRKSDEEKWCLLSPE